MRLFIIISFDSVHVQLTGNRNSIGILEGQACCSKETITFHYLKPKDMVDLDHLLYTCN